MNNSQLAIYVFRQARDRTITSNWIVEKPELEEISQRELSDKDMENIMNRLLDMFGEFVLEADVEVADTCISITLGTNYCKTYYCPDDYGDWADMMKDEYLEDFSERDWLTACIDYQKCELVTKKYAELFDCTLD